ncbi:hypothetical protein [Paucibacter sp. M5-1]|uniref:hypothetical protein n=1 Tax=Paucibacter sp. M5-1 TaxID=3015998 RepID=UPI0022B8D0FC|nr:hypothetical protein [Paucibacter sp. M5-1]MCZ7881124.1 hypothetical protein [Paucibacter sp. M5-1]
MTDKLAHALLERQGSSGPDGLSVQARTSADFVVNGTSLLQTLVKAHGGHSDFMGRFIAGYPENNQSAADELLGRVGPETGDHLLLYICPECGDIGCGAYAARVQRHAGNYTWLDFMYVNGHEPPRAISTVGPFQFAVAEYEHAIAAASAL